MSCRIEPYRDEGRVKTRLTRRRDTFTCMLHSPYMTLRRAWCRGVVFEIAAPAASSVPRTHRLARSRALPSPQSSLRSLRSRLTLPLPLLPWLLRRGASRKPSGRSFQFFVAGRVFVCVLMRRSAATSSLESSYS